MSAQVIEVKQGGAWAEMPPLAKNVIIIGGTAVLLFALYKGYQYSQNKSSRQTAKEAGKEQQNLVNLGSKPNYSDAQLEIWASNLAGAFSGAGTDEETVMRVMKEMKNDADVLRLIKVYGTRSYGGAIYGKNKYDLPQALTDELSEYYISQINTIFQKQGIKYRF